MQQVLRVSLTALAAAALVYAAALTSAQEPVKQIKLTEKQIEGFIAAHKEMTEMLDKMSPEKEDKTADAQLDAIARKFGFKDHKEYDEVDANISMVAYAIDPKTRVFTDPPILASKELEDAKADKSLSEEERKKAVELLTEQLKLVEPIMHPGNIDLVKKYFDKIEPLLQLQ
jgi:hypothetical protein